MRKSAWLLAAFSGFSGVYAAEGNISVSIVKLEQAPLTELILIIGFAAVFILVLYFLLRKWKGRKKGIVEELIEKKGEDEKEEEPELEINSQGMTEAEKYLKEDEKIVVNVLKQKGGTTTQGTLRVVTDFSKAKLSRILKELEERGIVHKEQRGNKNIVTLKELK